MSFSGEAAEKIARFARIFHAGKFGTAVRMLALEGLARVDTKEDYLALLEKFSDSTEVPGDPGPSVYSQESNAPVNTVEQRAAAVLDLVEKAREKPGIKKRKSGSHRS